MSNHTFLGCISSDEVTEWLCRACQGDLHKLRYENMYGKSLLFCRIQL